jgi:hypothetical protein
MNGPVATRSTSTNRQIAAFDPKTAKSTIETLKAAINYARRMHEWEAGLEAAELMVKWQREFVGWWSVNVGVRQAAGGNQHRTNADLRSSISREKAEAEKRYPSR